jgi:antitoxin (DNA-binding transcriptional repressor) of toxin-antitoxin stability system
MYIRRMTSMNSSEARAALPEILDRVLAGEEITITRHGRPVAVVVRPDTIRTRRADRALADAERLRELLRRGASVDLAAAPPLTSARADELVADVHASRASR